MFRNRWSRCVVLGSPLLLAAVAGANDPYAPDFSRPFNGVPIAREEPFVRMLAPVAPGARNLEPAALPGCFVEQSTTPASTGMTAGFAYFGQFVDHDIDLSLEHETEFLAPPFVKALDENNGAFTNLRTPGFDLDSVYGFGPLDGPSQASQEGWYTNAIGGSGLKFRFEFTDAATLDYVRDPQTGRAYIGDPRNDENGIVGQIHRGFMQLHNVVVDEILERDGVDENSLTPGSPEWQAIFDEARNFTTAYYQGIVANEFARHLTGRTLFEALDDAIHPITPLAQGQIPLEFAQSVYRLHTIVPSAIQVDSVNIVSPIDPSLRDSVNWDYLFGAFAQPASRVDTRIPAPLRNIVSLVIPGVGSVTLDLAQINLMRGREVELPAAESYLASLRTELGLPPNVTNIRGKSVLTPANALFVLDPIEDADLLADITAGDTDLWAYVLVEAELNGGVLGPVGQDILERTWITTLVSDDWSLIGANSGQFSTAQMEVFQNATVAGLLEKIVAPGDVNKDATVNATDLAFLLGLWGTSELAADINNDGVVDAIDLGFLLGSWGETRR